MNSIRAVIVGSIIFALSGLAAWAVDVSGTYENSGTALSTSLEEPAGAVPFRGLLGLEFDLPLARALHSGTDKVTITQTGSSFTIECKDADGGQTWSGRWKIGEGYGIEANQVKLVFRSKRYEFDGFYFLLSTVSEQKLLLVEVQRVQTTWLGPVIKPLGTFLFERTTRN